MRRFLQSAVFAVGLLTLLFLLFRSSSSTLRPIPAARSFSQYALQLPSSGVPGLPSDANLGLTVGPSENHLSTVDEGPDSNETGDEGDDFAPFRPHPPPSSEEHSHHQTPHASPPNKQDSDHGRKVGESMTPNPEIIVAAHSEDSPDIPLPGIDLDSLLKNPALNGLSHEAIAAIATELLKQDKFKSDPRPKVYHEPNGRPPIPAFGDPEAMILDIPYRDQTPEPADDGSHMEPSRVQDYADAIMDLGNSIFWRMSCPGEGDLKNRYHILKWGYNVPHDAPKIKYLFALDLTQVVTILPRLLGSIVQTIRHLGPEFCMLSIVEGRSSDGTYLVLHELRHRLSEAGIQYRLQQTGIDPHAEGNNRIEELAKLRNLALTPLLDEEPLFAPDPITLFINDIAVCVDDMLELLYQHVLQNATQTCAMDWVNGGDIFYDSWVSRSLSGNTFFEIPQDATWAYHANLFWDEPVAAGRYEHRQPFQVFACWGGMVTLDARPFMDGLIKFRRSDEGECYAGEPTTWARDLAALNQSRVLTVPTVNVAYSDAEGQRVRQRKGQVQDHVDWDHLVQVAEDDTETERVVWKNPPRQWKCMPNFGDNWWVPPVWGGGIDGVDGFD